MTPPKPCPWCGCQPVVEPTNPKVRGDAWGRVMCVSYTCVAKPFVDDGALVTDHRGSDAYKELAIERWNRRAGEQ